MQIGGEWLDARSGKTFETIDPCVSDMYRSDLLYVYTASPFPCIGKESCNLSMS